ncbi:GNAT family N-acetyltransferase [Candidatus Nitrosarchaeum limnium]|jgi:N-acetylglutamate synthase-like GNAT family acetyltransferase|uniref:Acetyltransferase, GNAT family n=1 Tax=Candidatus Nitrosarchaeum limnium BG20 TaxID=859192 RepID=S2E045_9ARCH|nr:GNAT family N-acetyltransferase [Candidatus Nitrosarchaeum limnium]EPA04303.1 acetyltransferase, GNAT family [Candidatus Nitrosarchaeum limnium BG20]
MVTIMIREANNSDKSPILNFCKNTFSWGDYIQYVWNYWLAEGNLFVIEKKQPVGICHAIFSKNQVWVEGIRINPDNHRQGLASKLVHHVESIAKEKQISFSYMLIDIENSSSLEMAKNLNYKIYETWNFYSILPQITHGHNIEFGQIPHTKKITHYVKSWRWLVLDEKSLIQLYKQNKIIVANNSGDTSIAILTDSEHFANTLIVTLFSGSEKNTLELISYIQNYCAEKKYHKIQILTREKISFTNSIEHKITFNLMRKSLN